MLFKLLSLLAAGKGGAAAAAAIVAGVTTVGVATTPAVQEGVQQVVAAVAQVASPGMSELAKLGKVHDPCVKGQPVVVAQRNAADKLLRDAYQSSYKQLSDLRGGKDVDHKAANAIVKGAQDELRDVLRASLNEVAALTLGREGQLKDEQDEDGDESPTPTPTPTFSTSRPSASPSASPTPKPTCAPAPSPTSSPTPAPDASPSGSPEADQRGRVAVASRVTLDPALAGIVEKAKADMQAIVDDAKQAISELEPVERGKPEDKDKKGDGRDDDASDDDEDNDEKGGQRGKPTDKPGGKPSTPPGRDR